MRLTLPRLLATVGALAAVSMLAIGGTYASFTATPVTISSNAFTAGSLTMTRSGTGAVFNLAAAKIGQEATGSVTITNTGTLPGAYTLEGSTTGPLAASLTLKIYRNIDNAAGSLVYSGTLAGVSAAPIDLGQLVALSGTATFYFHVALPTTGTDAGDSLLQGQTATASFSWKATQV